MDHTLKRVGDCNTERVAITYMEKALLAALGDRPCFDNEMCYTYKKTYVHIFLHIYKYICMHVFFLTQTTTFGHGPVYITIIIYMIKFYTQKFIKNTPKHSKMSLKSKIYAVIVLNLENFTPDRIFLHGHCNYQV